ncbi:hypothetical protein [Holospora obtusa]|nr:hypothetical protein [Holospora obtusa]
MGNILHRNAKMMLQVQKGMQKKLCGERRRNSKASGPSLLKLF